MWQNETTRATDELEVALRTSALVIILVVSFVGNTVIIIVVHRSRRNQWTTNHFVLNLAVVNLIASTMYLPLTLDSVFRGHWLFGNFGCKLWAFLQHFNLFVSVGILCCMSFDRFYLTAFPLTFKLSKTQTKKLIFAIWILAAAACSPLFHFYELGSGKSRLNECLPPKYSRDWTAYVATIASLFAVLHFATYTMYVRVYLCIKARNRKPAGSNQRFATGRVPRTKIKVTKLLVIQLAVHTVLWWPFVVHQVVSSTSGMNLTANTVTLYLTRASTAASPLVYTVFSGDFRRGCKQILTKYDASNAYRLPAALERKNRVDVLTTTDFVNDSEVRYISTKRESREQVQVHSIGSFEQPKKPRLAWSNECSV